MSRRAHVVLLAGALFGVLTGMARAAPLDLTKPGISVRFATFNAALSREGAGVLLKDFAKGEPRIEAVAQIIRHVRPDILLINEIDHDPGNHSLHALVDQLQRDGEGTTGIRYDHTFTAPSNTGEPSGLDLNGDGRIAGPLDAYGFGRFPGQFGMAMLSRFPLGEARTFRLFPWSEMPGARRPVNADGTPFHLAEIWRSLRLSSKSHWDIVVTLPDGRDVHLLASHPTPPVFDGPEDRNGRRNADEIRLLADYIDPARSAWITDDAGRSGGLAEGAAFVVAGDLNADPVDGDGLRAGIIGLLQIAQDPKPQSPGAAEAAGGANRFHRGDKALDTADWKDEGGPGNLRVDFVLPSPGLEIAASGVFWPAEGDALRRLVGSGGKESSDHRLVWVDIR